MQKKKEKKGCKKPKRERNGTERKCGVYYVSLIGVTMFMHLPYIMANKRFTMTHNSNNNNMVRHREIMIRQLFCKEKRRQTNSRRCRKNLNEPKEFSN